MSTLVEAAHVAERAAIVTGALTLRGCNEQDDLSKPPSFRRCGFTRSPREGRNPSRETPSVDEREIAIHIEIHFSRLLPIFRKVIERSTEEARTRILTDREEHRALILEKSDLRGK